MITLAIAISLAATTPASAPDRAGALVEQAREALGAGRTEEAIGRFREALQADPRNAAAHNALGSILNSTGRYPQALPHALAAVRIDPANPRYRYNRGVVLAEHGRFKEAIRDFDLALAAHPAMTYAWLERGAARLSLGDLAGARADWAQAAKADPKLIWVRWYQATGDFIDGNYARAAEGFDAVAAAETGFVPAKLWRVLAHSRAGTRITVPEAGSADWPAPILAYLRGQLGEGTLIRTALADRVTGDQRRLGEANFALAIERLGTGDRVGARKYLRRAISVKAPRHYWKIAAQRELARLG